MVLVAVGGVKALVDLAHDQLVLGLLELGVLALELQFVVQLLDARHALGVRAAVVGAQERPLLLVAPSQRAHHQPAALALLDVGAHFARDTRIAKAIDVVILENKTFNLIYGKTNMVHHVLSILT